jgi:cytochrome c553
MKKFTFLLLMLVFTGFVACKKDNTNVDGFQCDNEISFASDVAPLINQNCATSGCHNASGAGGYVLTTHAQISNHATIMLNAIQHKPGFTAMPIGAPKLSDEQIKAFACWIQQGKLNN